MEEQSRQLKFLMNNMMEMEIELRAHSILLDALSQKVITVEEIPDNLALAREAPAMLGYVREKYHLLAQRSSHTNEQGEFDPTGMVFPQSDFRYKH